MAAGHQGYFQPGAGGSFGALVGAGIITDKRAACVARRLDEFALVWITAGGGWFSHGDRPREAVAAGDVLLLFPGIVHSYAPGVPGDWSEHWLMFRGALFDLARDHGLLSPARPRWRVGDQPEALAACAALVADRRRDGASAAAQGPPAAQAAETALAVRTLDLLSRLARVAADEGPAAPPWLATACAALAADLHRPVDLARIARDCGFGYERFRKLFAAAIGMPPARWRLLRRIDRAKALLAEGLSGEAVAERLGFCDVYFFTRQFRAVTGTTPARFRGGRAQRPFRG